MKIEIGFLADFTDTKGCVTSGYCFGAELTGTTLVDRITGHESPGVRFRVREADTGREFWTTTFPSSEDSKS